VTAEERVNSLARPHSGSARNKGPLFQHRFTTYLLAHDDVLREYVPARSYESKGIVAPWIILRWSGPGLERRCKAREEFPKTKE
jgi:hypothetical protein